MKFHGDCLIFVYAEIRTFYGKDEFFRLLRWTLFFWVVVLAGVLPTTAFFSLTQHPEDICAPCTLYGNLLGDPCHVTNSAGTAAVLLPLLVRPHRRLSGSSS